MTSRVRPDLRDDGAATLGRTAADRMTRSADRSPIAHRSRPGATSGPTCPTGRLHRRDGVVAAPNAGPRRSARCSHRCEPGRVGGRPAPEPDGCRRFSVWGCQKPARRPGGPCRCRWQAADLPCSCCRSCVRSLLPRRAGCPSRGTLGPQDGAAVAFRDAETSWMTGSATRWRGAEVPDMTLPAYRPGLRSAGRVSAGVACAHSAPCRTSRNTRADWSRHRR